MGSLAQAANRGFLGVSDPDDAGQVAGVINNILAGKLNNSGVVTLVANAATTTLTDSRIGIASHISLMPTTINAAGEIPNIYFTTFAAESCVINHPNNAKTDRVFCYAVTG